VCVYTARTIFYASPPRFRLNLVHWCCRCLLMLCVCLVFIRRFYIVCTRNLISKFSSSSSWGRARWVLKLIDKKQVLYENIYRRATHTHSHTLAVYFIILYRLRTNVYFGEFILKTAVSAAVRCLFSLNIILLYRTRARQCAADAAAL